MLTPKQKAFADYYIECGNATEAARKAGYSLRTASAVEAVKCLVEIWEQTKGWKNGNRKQG